MIIKEFGKANYESVIYVDFRSNSMIHSAFDGDFDINLKIMVMLMLVKMMTLIVYQ